MPDQRLEPVHVRVPRNAHDLELFVLMRPADQSGIDGVDVASFDPDEPDLRELAVQPRRHEYQLRHTGHASGSTTRSHQVTRSPARSRGPLPGRSPLTT
ncbi:hypothetical protein PSA01_59480 [Pseudonocardia saturnea]|uniref:Uncharacterized protein n=1 Tax=Pseudonocardia saturnea TaxID=33909 RepID=A0ABQ0S7M0_9PSEU|nr:hypothetical protein PSA01_59480 [Pseudonocardia saturnea]